MFATEKAKSLKPPVKKSNHVLWVEAIAFSLIIGL
jgi:hypothetical protein